MDSRSNLETPRDGRLENIRIGALIAAVIGGLGSVCLMLMSGLHPPVFLVILFIGWVLAPFAALVFGNVVSRRWPVITRYTLYGVTLLLAACSLAIYAYVDVRPLPSQPAFPFVAVPIGSWLLILIAIPLAALISSRRSKKTS